MRRLNQSGALATGPSLVLPRMPDPGEVVRAAQSYDPTSNLVNDTLYTMPDITLRGPIVCNPKDVGTRLPAGAVCGFLADIKTPPGLRHSQDGKKHLRYELMRFVAGMASRLGGVAVPPPGPSATFPTAAVWTQHARNAADLARLFAPHITGVRLKEENGGLFKNRTSYDCDGPYSLSQTIWTDAKPGHDIDMALRWLGVFEGDLHRYDITLLTHDDPNRAHTQAVAASAFALANDAGGIILDRYEFRAMTPEELLPTLTPLPATAR